MVSSSCLLDARRKPPAQRSSRFATRACRAATVAPGPERHTRRVTCVGMKYISCQVTNYKSFHGAQEQPISFDPRFNILVGQNNVGKTALLEALSLRFPNNPHRSLVSAPRVSEALPVVSSVELTYSAAGTEVTELLSSRVDLILIPFPASAPSQSEEIANDALRRIQEGTVTITARFDGGSPQAVTPLSGPYSPVGMGGGNAVFMRQPDRRWKFSGTAGTEGRRLEYVLTTALQERVYNFRAERLHVGLHGFGNNPILAPSANNLPEVLNALQTQNPARFKRYNDLVGRVFPSIRWIGVRPIPANQLEIVVWELPLETERQDLAVSLLESGTGISQVLAMLYVIVTAESDRVFIIDEPNSFLHPGAVRSLLEILREHPRHQYIISTHAPQTIAAVGPDARIHLLQKSVNQATTVVSVNQAETAQIREVLAEVGARISDVFGAESILWVEGATEEQCFRLIIERVLRLPLRSIAVVGVRHTGDFDRRNARWALELYERISRAGALMPPALGFIFDRETRTATEMEDITRQSRGAVSFLPYRMYENYLLTPGAIASALGSRGITVPQERITTEVASRRANAAYYGRGDTSDPTSIDGAAVLRDLFATLSDSRLEYAKVQDGIALTTWLLEHDPSALAPVAELLREKLRA
jgi:predicted ATPase